MRLQEFNLRGRRRKIAGFRWSSGMYIFVWNDKLMKYENHIKSIYNLVTMYYISLNQ